MFGAKKSKKRAEADADAWTPEERAVHGFQREPGAPGPDVDLGGDTAPDDLGLTTNAEAKVLAEEIYCKVNGSGPCGQPAMKVFRQGNVDLPVCAPHFASLTADAAAKSSAR